MPDTNTCAVWEFVFPAPDHDEEALELFKDRIRQLFKKWVFQYERGDTGYLHYQGRGSLFKKRRLSELVPLMKGLGFHLQLIPTVKQNMTVEAFYQTKVDSRLEGPWTNLDSAPMFIPLQYRGLLDRLYPFQQHIWDSIGYNPRAIDLVYCPQGCRGKSSIACLCALYKGALRMPPVNDAEKLTQAVCCRLMAAENRTPAAVFFDLPRAMDKSKLAGLFTAIEEVKAGYVYDCRYSYKDWWFNSPAVWVFMNTWPDLNMMSPDRWHVWQINDDHEFEGVPVVPVG